ncbi:protoporphyrinogen/coproporphyrinogen oxidase [Niabella sp. CJ426]|uniref:protoporphyrinogen/coproporphyrinogen oxidase n=1 Tax=Niabella sp. CJ426 TaxID=3393740 RepID=UPI003D04E19C
MEKIAIVGGGLSGLSIAQLLKSRYDITLFEANARPGGLIKCERVEGSLYHICGGHVFNSKRQDVLDWFWSFFDQEKEFIKAERNAVVFMDNGTRIPYPIENHIYLFEKEKIKSILNDLLEISRKTNPIPENFEDFLKGRFGKTLYEDYFQPYNEKIWQSPLNTIPLSWLEGKLPMPSVEDIVFNNITQVKEKEFVHSSFWYEKENGSQFIIDRISEGLNIKCNHNVNDILKKGNAWYIGAEKFDKIIFCGVVKDLPSILKGIDISNFTQNLNNLDYHGTTSVFCEIDENPYSWIYLPSKEYQAHRIICTGNFAKSNNEEGKMTATVEFTDRIEKKLILEQLSKMPLNPKYITHRYNEYSYPIQDVDTRATIAALKRSLADTRFYITGRFADWEYYNMDAAIGAAIDLSKTI